MMPRKFRVLQIGGDDLEPIFQHKKGVSWDYFDIGLFEFDSGYVEAIEAIVEAEGRFDFIYIQAPYSETLTNLFQMISENHTIRMLMNHFGLLNMNKTKMSKNTLFNHYITGTLKNVIIN